MFENLVITFKNGEVRAFGKDEWNDYRYDGKTIRIIKEAKSGDMPTVAIYNIDVIYSVELI